MFVTLKAARSLLMIIIYKIAWNLLSTKNGAKDQDMSQKSEINLQ